MLLALAAAGFLVAAGVGLWIGGQWWRTVAVAGLASSLMLMILFFHTWFLPIQILNVALLVGLLWSDRIRTALPSPTRIRQSSRAPICDGGRFTERPHPRTKSALYASHSRAWAGCFATA